MELLEGYPSHGIVAYWRGRESRLHLDEHPLPLHSRPIILDWNVVSGRSGATTREEGEAGRGRRRPPRFDQLRIHSQEIATSARDAQQPQPGFHRGCSSSDRPYREVIGRERVVGIVRTRRRLAGQGGGQEGQGEAGGDGRGLGGIQDSLGLQSGPGRRCDGGCRGNSVRSSRFCQPYSCVPINLSFYHHH